MLGTVVLLTLVVPAPDPRITRLRQFGALIGRPGLVEPASPGGRVNTWIGQVAERLGRTLGARDPKTRSAWQRLLAQAGYRKADAVRVFQGSRILLAGLLPGAFLFLTPTLNGWTGVHQSTAVLVLVAAGLFLPHWWLLRKVRSRREEITDALPNALDLMVVCVEAGLGLDATIQRVAQDQQFTRQALSEEFQIVHRETRAGRPRSEALLALRERVDSPELSSLVVVLVQAEKVGTSIAQALRVHADSLRTKRRQRAEERAAKIPVKMVFPLVLLIFPATLLVLLGPSYLLIFKALSAIPK